MKTFGFEASKMKKQVLKIFRVLRVFVVNYSQSHESTKIEIPYRKNEKMLLSEGFFKPKLRAQKTERCGISGAKFSVDITEERIERHLEDIVKIIEMSDLDNDIKDLSKEIFRELARVEAKIHGKNIEEIHFHEVGGLDCLIDVTCSLIGIKMLGIEALYSSRIHLGRGFVECEHGIIPVPAPATLELLKEIPIYSAGIEAELTTPTGAAILKKLSKGFGVMPGMKVEKIGYGAGRRELEIPNLLRVYVGESKSSILKTFTGSFS